MKRSLMLAASVAAFVAPAGSALAQEEPLFRSRDDIRAARRADEGAQAQASVSVAQPQEHREERREMRQERREERRDQMSERQTSPRQAAAAPSDPNQPLFRDRQDILDARRADERRIRREQGLGEQHDGRNGRRDGREDRRDRREYRDFRQRFNSDLWRQQWQRQRGYDWWRNDYRFRGYNGLRMGFYFAPGYGYYSVPRSYWGQRYYEGQYLPSVFWRYSLNDWRTFGLGYPPPGTRWVMVDNSIYLIDEFDGYIVHVVRDAWRW